MKTRKTVIAVLTALLVVSAVLIAGCIDPLEQVSVKQKAADTDELGDAEAPAIASNFKIPAGKGVVRFKISDANARTILPDNTGSGFQVSDMFFDVVFTKSGTSTVYYYPDNGDDGASPGDTKLAFSAINTTPLALDTGDYDISITAWSTDDSSNDAVPIAMWDSAAPYTIIASDVVIVTANLAGIVDGNDTGTFSYSITLPAGVSSTFVATKYGDTTPINIGTLTANTANTSTKDLDSGYYIVTLTVTRTDYQTRQYVRALHIYPAMTSKLTISVPALVKVANLTVDFDLGEIYSDGDSDYVAVEDTGGSASGNDYSQLTGLDYGDKISDFGDEPVATNFPTYSFGGWYKASDGHIGTGTKWDFDTDMVLADTILYAKWNAPGQGTFSLTITFDYEDLIANKVDGTASIARGDLDGDKSTKLTLGNAPDSGVWKDVVWNVVGLDFTTTHASLITDSDMSLIVNNSAAYKNILSSDFEVTVIADLYASDGTTLVMPNLSSTVTITVTDN